MPPLFLGSILKTVTGIAGSVLPGPLGGIARTANRFLGGGARTAPAARPISVYQQPIPQRLGGQAQGSKCVGLILPSGRCMGVGTRYQASGQISPNGGARAPAMQGGNGNGCEARACCSGTHLNKTGYYLKSGQYVEPESACVKNRRMNPANGRAAMRAVRRLKATDKLMRGIQKEMKRLAR